ncbi:peptidase inhibitor family I36 protein [Streptomyces avicenniae]|uniref:peptidase inhibitor family I36 protein n=1 Tax=Streptomyces avicenniae TaxID=500153 RepID=UPI00069C9A88|nr:peptidase inhibitor family I36 protein [Streptomyces avicenniae]
MGRIRFKGKTAAVAASATLLAGLGLGLMASPAQASWDDCESGALCAYTQTSGGGTPGQVWGDNVNLRQYNKFDNARSLYNNGNQCDVVLYTNTWFRGTAQLFLRGYVVSNTDGTNYEDGVGSNIWTNC